MRYTQAQESGDVQAAATAALEAWHAGRAMQVDADTLKALGTNAVNAHFELHDWQVLAEIAPEIAILHDLAEQQEEETALLLVGIALQAADNEGDHVTYGQALPFGLRLAARHGHAHRSWTEGMLVPDPPQTAAEFDGAGIGDLEDAVNQMLAAGVPDARRYTNVVVSLIDQLQSEEQFDRAWFHMEEAIQTLSVTDENGADDYRDTVLSRVSGLLTEGFQDSASGAERFAPQTRPVWCAYMRRTPVTLEPGAFVEFPMRAMMNGNRYAVVESLLEVPAAGGEPAITDMHYEGREERAYLRSVRQAIRESGFRPQCEADASVYTVRRVDLFGLAELSEGRGGVRFTARGRVETAYFLDTVLSD